MPLQSAILIKKQKTKTLVIADLHIGWEMALSEKGIHVPTQTPKLLKKLKDILVIHKPEKLLVLGDVKHTVATAELGEWQDIPEFFTQIKKMMPNVSVIRGNHDGNLEPLLPEGVKLLPSTGVSIGDVGLFHGHRWPSPTLLRCKTWVMGHVHPVIVFRDPAGFKITRQVWIKISCDTIKLTKILLQKHKIKVENTPEKTLRENYKITPKTRKLFIMPSFNDLLGGRPLNERKTSERIVGPILRSDAVNLRDAEVYLLDGTFLGTLNQLRNLS
jgi:hypothetical protein